MKFVLIKQNAFEEFEEFIIPNLERKKKLTIFYRSFMGPYVLYGEKQDGSNVSFLRPKTYKSVSHEIPKVG